MLITGVAVVVVVMCCKRNPDTPDRKKGCVSSYMRRISMVTEQPVLANGTINRFRYMKDANQKTNIKPPDLWIHHDQMELKALEKSSINGEASTSGVTSNTLPRPSNQDYNEESVRGNSSSLDKRTYVPSYMGKKFQKITPNATCHDICKHDCSVFCSSN